MAALEKGPIDDSTHGRRRLLSRPRAPELIDGGGLLILCVLAGIVLQPTFGGWTYLVSMMAAVVIGMVVAFVTSRLRLPDLATALLAALAFFCFGGLLVLRSTAIAGVLPTASTLRSLAGDAIRGWMDILTTVHPVGTGEDLMVIPYLLGMFAGALGFSLALRTRWAPAPLLAPVGLLCVAILFGSDHATLLPVTGGVVAIVACGWTAVRHARTRPPRAGGQQGSRVVLAAGLLTVSGVVAWPVSSALPFAHAHDRVVLQVDPPFDLSAYASPLAGFRKYRPAPGAANATLFTLRDMPAGTPVRIATLDTYDGVVWGVGVDSQNVQGSPETFRQVGSTIPTLVTGQSATVGVTIAAGYSDVWLPNFGAVTSVNFEGADLAAKAMRYNLATGTAIVPDHVVAGDQYSLRAVIQPMPSPATLQTASPALDRLAVSGAPDGLFQIAQQWSSGAQGAYAQIAAIASHMRENGMYSDGYDAGVQVLPGHSQGRLTAFLTAPQLVGDDEQYAAALALLGGALGVPTRVVLGATPTTDGVVRSGDVHAWDEVQLQGIGWVALFPTPDQSRHPNPDPPRPAPQQAQPQRVVPPVVPPASQAGDDAANPAASDNRSPAPRKPATAAPAPIAGSTRVLLYVAIAALGMGVLAGGLLLLKAHRRRRRRRARTAIGSLAGGWVEILDLARDMGIGVDALQTRREQARTIARPSAMAVAHEADAAIFGPGEPLSADLDAYWYRVMSARRDMTADLSWIRRLRVALSLASLRANGRSIARPSRVGP